MEADSLNCIVLANDVTPSMPEWDIFIKEVRKEITVKPKKSALQSAEFLCLRINWKTYKLP